MKYLAFCLFLLSPLAAQQRVAFHKADVSAQWIQIPYGQYQKITGKLPPAVLKALVYDDAAGVWEIYLSRRWDDRGGSWQRQEILHEGEWIDIDAQGRISVEWR